MSETCARLAGGDGVRSHGGVARGARVCERLTAQPCIGTRALQYVPGAECQISVTEVAAVKLETCNLELEGMLPVRVVYEEVVLDAVEGRQLRETTKQQTNE